MTVRVVLPLCLLLGAAVACALESGCREGIVGTTYATRRPPTLDEQVARVSRVRHAPLSAPIVRRELDDASFLAALEREDLRSVHGGENAFLAAFALSASEEEANRVGMEPIEKRVAGFYSPTEHTLVVRRNGATKRLERELLSHEIEHAILDARFGAPDISHMGLDAALAARAMLEGDTTLTSLVVAGDELGLSHALVVTRASRHEELEGAAPAPGPETVRELQRWPYLRGTAFVADLVRIGGWALVDAAMRSPPTTTEQVIHLDKYLAGEKPLVVKPPVPPERWTIAGDGRLGELAMRMLLAECTTDEDARAAAASWGGDAFTLVKQGTKRGILWSSAWDDEAAAQRFQRALEARHACTRTGPKPAFVVHREGRNVGFAQGVEEDQAIVAMALTAPVEALPPVPPLGDRKVPPRASAPDDFVGKVHTEGGTLIDDSIGLRVPIDGLTVQKAPAEWSFAGRSRAIFVGARAMWSPPSPALEDSVTEAFVEWVRRSRNARNAQAAFDEGTTRVVLPWATADRRTVTFADNTEVELFFARACSGRMTYIVATMWPPFVGGEEKAKEWLANVKIDGADASASCKAAREMKDPDAP